MRPTFDDILNELRDLQQKKGEDYGSNEDPLANLLASTQFGIEPWVGTILRANDKMARVQTFVKKGSLANESLDDSLRDLAVYAIHALRLYRENKIEKSNVVKCHSCGKEFDRSSGEGRVSGPAGAAVIVCGECMTRIIAANQL